MLPIAIASSGDGEHDADPEAAGHVAQFGILFGGRGDRARLERHAADGAVSGFGAHDLRMHGACVLGARGGQRDVALEGHAAGRTGPGLGFANFGAHGADVGNRASGFRLPAFERGHRSGSRAHPEGHKARCGGLVQIRLRIGFEFLRATGAAEVIVFPGVLVRVLGVRGIHVHAADGVALGRVRGCHRHWVFRRQEIISIAPPGLADFIARNPQVALWAAFCRRSAAVSLATALCCWIADALYWIHPAGWAGLPIHHTERLNA